MAGEAEPGRCCLSRIFRLDCENPYSRIPAMTTRAMASLFFVSVFAAAVVSEVASTGIPERLCTRLRVEGFDSTVFGTRTLPGREEAMLGERDKGRVWSGGFVLLDMRRWEKSDFAAAAAEMLSPPARRAASRRAVAWSREEVAVRCFLVGGSWIVSEDACWRLCGRKIAGIDSQSSSAGDMGGEGRLAGSRRSEDMASASTWSTCASDVPASTATPNGEDAGGVGSLCPRTG